MIDPYALKITRLIRKHLDQQVWVRAATITSYKRQGHRASVRLHPRGAQANDIPILVPTDGFYAEPPVGANCAVLLDRNVPLYIVGFQYNQNLSPPSIGTDLVLRKDISTFSDMHVGQFLYLGRFSSLPAASAALRGAMLAVTTEFDNTAGSADALYVCLQGAGGTPTWKLIVSG